MESKERTLEAFGAVVCKLRTDLGLTQEDLADRTQFDRTYISMIERGKRNLSLLNICRFAKALGTSASEVLREMERVENVRKSPRHPKRKTQ